MTPTADGHLHLFAGGYPAVRSLAGPEVGVYEGLRAEHGIVEALVVGYEGATFAAGNNEYLRSLAANRDWMHTTAYVDARADVTAALARDIVAAGHVGVSLYATEDGLAQAIRRWSVEFWTECNRARMIVSVNAAPESIGLLAELPLLAPDCSFLFAHLGLPGRYATPPSEAAAAARIAPLLRLARHPNCHVKLSGLYAIGGPSVTHPAPAASPFVQQCLRSFGAPRCIWGSDFAPAIEHVTFEQCTVLPDLDDLTGADRELVLGGNLRRMLAQRGSNSQGA